jgi:hypothetical protein
MMHLTLTLKRATGLKKTDCWSESDPYVTFRLFEGRKRVADAKSTVLMNAKDPNWSQDFQFELALSDLSKYRVTASVFDWDLISDDEPLGGVSIDLSTVVAQPPAREGSWGRSYNNRYELVDWAGTGSATNSFLYLDFTLATPEQHESGSQETIWENQRWQPMKGWSPHGLLPTERKTWSDEAGDPRLSHTNFETALRKNGMDPDADGQWYIVCNAGLQTGWQYSPTFDFAGGFDSHSGTTSLWEPEQHSWAYVRRRKWCRHVDHRTSGNTGTTSSTAKLGKSLLLAATSNNPDQAAAAAISSHEPPAPSPRLASFKSKLDEGKITRGEYEELVKHDQVFMAQQEKQSLASSSAVLEVTLFSASGLPHMDILKLPGSACDPFVRITAEDAVVVPEQSTVKNFTQNPVWGTGEAFHITFAPGAPLPAAVEVGVFDHDTFTADDYIGRAVLAVPAPDAGGTQECPIIGMDGTGNLGTVHLGIKWVMDAV